MTRGCCVVAGQEMSRRRYLASVKLETSSVLDMWGGVQYLPLDTEPFLRVQTLVNRSPPDILTPVSR